MKLARRDFVASLQTGLAVIEAFDSAHSRLTLTEVAARTGLTRAAARRYLLTLAHLGYADYDGKHFSLDLRVLRLGYGLLSAAPLPRKSQPVLDTVSLKTNETASIAVLDETAVVFLARSHSRRVFSPTVGVGTRLPAFCLSTGRVLLAQKTDVEVRMLLGHTDLTPFTPHTLVDVDAIVAAVRDARERGYALSDQEYELGLRSLAVPVPNASGRSEVAMTVSVQAAQMGMDEMVERLLPPLLEGARDLCTLL
ncbi:IclR family transcriptional regulator C-terminal domain-containing protein [Aquabacterium sp. J223]|uniref:IclR family transcriptional regulator domain-containing protein n=1 Tax=Aquabacterium sp. J223 TaxID=2898431 RepID=UPI0021ADD852|nr:IclR family transcriptional regulator C-terminal domain-containing protein [Aquabacterium sp. J223]UUX94490.1 helix-turn-helix domain-containing protein [Aquabacterium sp. J223]